MNIESFIHSPTVAAASGSAVWFLVGIKLKRIKNNRYRRKLALEIGGGSLTGTYLHPLLGFLLPTFTAAFIIGLGWSEIAQQLRNWVTRNINNDVDVTRRRNA